ncbi:hypothetical protein CINS5906_04590 [Campylobacter insulaenigrae]|uniref:hypothetical protein n=1 Tax=Campylobacter insulaenigrae TaxID=260714 RepID=UPI0021536543|nr:hypothetical protein [Campylobacter insulaenigrae]MCR6577540.1 hypothetical protein [Campylobacter insulaenigrae]MCR6584838.1 hypothetical protein [Campylobacter insulaenigrae]
MQINSYSRVAMESQISNRKADLNTKLEDTNTKSANSTKDIDKDKLDKLASLGGKGITELYTMSFMQQTLSISSYNSFSQASIANFANSNNSLSSILSGVDFKAIGYEGKDILSLNSEEAKELIGEDGFFGVTKTSQRLADFVINGAGEDIDKLQKGLEGLKSGFAQAEKMWGGKLPDISYETIDKAIEKVTQKINDLGGNSLNINA